MVQQVQYVSHSHSGMHNIFLLPCCCLKEVLNFLAANEVSQHTPKVTRFFSFWGRWERCWIFWIFFVPTVFPQRAPNVFPNKCPIYLPPMLSSWNLHRWATIGTYVFLCLDWIFLYFGLLKVSNFFCDGPIEEAPCKETILNLEGDP